MAAHKKGEAFMLNKLCVLTIRVKGIPSVLYRSTGLSERKGLWRFDCKLAASEFSNHT